MFRSFYSLPLLLFILLIVHPHPLRADNQLFLDTLQLAEQGDKEAQFSLGLLYDTGSHNQRNPEQAVYWFTKAAAAGVAGACLYLGMKYEFGAGVSQNRKKARHWYEQAALQGWPQAAFMLGSLYLRADPVDLVHGCTWLEIAAEQEYPGAEQARQQACFNLNKGTARKVHKLRKQLRKRIYPTDTTSASE